MSFDPSQKENMLLQDQQKHEELCIQKYQGYSQQAQDPQLKQLFNSLAQQEQEHLNSVNQLLSGQVPNLQQGQQEQSQQAQGQSMQMQQDMGQQGQSQGQGQTPQQIAQSSMGGNASQSDITMCDDMLATEKYISGVYDATIFECTNAEVRQVLNHIQKEEQEHGEALFYYLQNQGAYNVQ